MMVETRKSNFRIIFFGLITYAMVATPNAHAAAYQLFTNLAYDNPANLNTVKDHDIILGGTYLQAAFDFKGSNGPLTGSAYSNEWTAIPYGRFAKRVNPELVLAVDVSSYQYADIEYPASSIVGSLSTGTILKSFDISPRLSYQITPQVSIGLGALVDRLYQGALNFVVPPNQLYNHGQDWAFGWTAGLSYAATPMTFVNLSYNSAIHHHVLGASSWGPLSSSSLDINAPIPAAYTINLLKILNQKWVLSGTVRYVCWNIVETLHVNNTALGTITFPEHYNNSWFGQLAAHYQINEQWGIGGTGIYESSPQETFYRPVGLPTYSVYTLGLGPDYAINKALSVKLLYGHAWSKPNINTMGPIGPVLGSVNIDGNMVDLSVNYKI